jgi:ABC-type multidrug transport system ATPase subunit
MLCDRVTILRKGEVVVSGRLVDLLKRDVRRTDVALAGAGSELIERFSAAGHGVRTLGERVVVEIEGESKVAEVLRAALDAGASVSEVIPRHETLEDLFVREAIDAAAEGAEH